MLNFNIFKGNLFEKFSRRRNFKIMARKIFKVTLWERPPEKTLIYLGIHSFFEMLRVWVWPNFNITFAARISTLSRKPSKPLKQSQAIRASKETQTKAKRASICAVKA